MQKNTEKFMKTQENAENHRKAKKCIKKYPCGGTLGDSWALLGRSWALLGRSWPLLGRCWVPVGRFLAISWAQLEKVSRATILFGLNLEPKTDPTWLQNPPKIDVKLEENNFEK